MGRITKAYILPHPPILVPEVGKGGEGKASATTKAFEKAAREIGEIDPTTIIITTPHGPMFQDFIHISATPELAGDFSKFGAARVRLEFKNNIPLINRIIELGNAEGIYCGGLEDSLAGKYKVPRELDHGALVPLYFITSKYNGFKLVHISIAGMPYTDLYKFGKCIAHAVNESGEKAVFIASGDLSHKLSADGPYGFDKSGPEFDRILVDSLKPARPEKLLSMDESFCETAGECGLRSFIIMFGALDGYEIKSDVYSYEGPFGVGYCVAAFEPGAPATGKGVLERKEEADLDKMKNIRAEEDPYVALARQTLEAYVKSNKTITVPDGLSGEMLKERAGVFVSIKKFGQLRGCIGTISPVRKNIAEEIINNAISAGTQDPRFDPIEANELSNLVYSVDVLMKPEAIVSIDELDVVKYGVIVRSGMRSGLLLPNLEGVDTPEQQVAIAMQKAGIRQDDKYKMERFKVVRHNEKSVVL